MGQAQRSNLRHLRGNISGRYRGARGARYFQYQSGAADTGGRLNAWKFEGYIKPSDYVVDFGAGSGGVLANIRARDKVAVEANAVARSYCRQRYGIRAISSLGHLKPYRVDVVISNHCLEHVPSPIISLRNIRRALRPGGKLLLYLPLEEWRNQPKYVPGDINGHLYTWTPQLLGNALEEAGFERIRICVYTNAWPKGYVLLSRIFPRIVFQAFCWLWAIIMRRRQLCAIAYR